MRYTVKTTAYKGKKKRKEKKNSPVLTVNGINYSKARFWPA